MTPRPSLRPFTKACPIHPDCTLVLCRVTLQSDLPAGAALATTVPGIMPGVFLWAASRPVAGHDEATLDEYAAQWQRDQADRAARERWGLQWLGE